VLWRAVLLLVVFVVLGVVLLQAFSRSPGVVVGAPVTTTTTTAPRATTTTTTAPHSATTVVVANATDVNGMAKQFSEQLTAQQWAVGTPVTAASQVPTSTIYYATGEQQQALEIANELGLKPDQVAALNSSVPVPSTSITGTDVVVVIGQDLTTAATTTTAG
jgi:hypothetical protein